MNRSRLSSTKHPDDAKAIHKTPPTSTNDARSSIGSSSSSSVQQQKRKSVTSSGYGVVSPSLYGKTSAKDSLTPTLKPSPRTSLGNTMSSTTRIVSHSASVNHSNVSTVSGSNTPGNRSSVKKPSSAPGAPTAPVNAPQAQSQSQSQPQSQSKVMKTTTSRTTGNANENNAGTTGGGGNRMIYSLISPVSSGGGGSGGRVRSGRFEPTSAIIMNNDIERDLTTSESKDSPSLLSSSPIQSIKEDISSFSASQELITTSVISSPQRRSMSPTTSNGGSPNRFSNSHEETPIVTVAALNEKRRLEGLEPLKDTGPFLVPSLSTDTDGPERAGTSGSSSGTIKSSTTTSQSANLAIRKSVSRPSSSTAGCSGSGLKTPSSVQRSSLSKTSDKTPATSATKSVSTSKATATKSNISTQQKVSNATPTTSTTPSAARKTPLTVSSLKTPSAQSGTTIIGSSQPKVITSRSVTSAMTTPTSAAATASEASQSLSSRSVKSHLTTSTPPSSSSGNNVKTKTLPSSSTAHDRYSSSVVHSATYSRTIVSPSSSRTTATTSNITPSVVHGSGIMTTRGHPPTSNQTSSTISTEQFSSTLKDPSGPTIIPTTISSDKNASSVSITSTSTSTTLPEESTIVSTIPLSVALELKKSAAATATVVTNKIEPKSSATMSISTSSSVTTPQLSLPSTSTAAASGQVQSPKILRPVTSVVTPQRHVVPSTQPIDKKNTISSIKSPKADLAPSLMTSPLRSTDQIIASNAEHLNTPVIAITTPSTKVASRPSSLRKNELLYQTPQTQTTPPNQDHSNGNVGSLSKANLRRSSIPTSQQLHPPNSSSAEPGLGLVRNTRISMKIVDISKEIAKSQQKKEEELYAMKVQNLQQQLEQLHSSSPSTSVNLTNHLHISRDESISNSSHNGSTNNTIITSGMKVMNGNTSTSQQQQQQQQTVNDKAEDVSLSSSSSSSWFHRNKFIEDDRNIPKRNSLKLVGQEGGASPSVMVSPSSSSSSITPGPPIPSSRWSKSSNLNMSSMIDSSPSSVMSNTSSQDEIYATNNEVQAPFTREKSIDRFPTSQAGLNRVSILSSSSSSSSSNQQSPANSLLGLTEAEENLLLDQMPPARVRQSSPLDSPDTGRPLPRTPSFSSQQQSNSRLPSPFVKRVGSGEGVGAHVAALVASLDSRHISPLRQPSPRIQSRHLQQQQQQQQLNQRLSNSSVSSAGSEASSKSQKISNESPSIVASLPLSPLINPTNKEVEVIKVPEAPPQKTPKEIQAEKDAEFKQKLLATLEENRRQSTMKVGGSKSNTTSNMKQLQLPSTAPIIKESIKQESMNSTNNNNNRGPIPSITTLGSLNETLSELSSPTMDSTASDELPFNVIQPLTLQKHHLLKPVGSKDDMSSSDYDLHSLSLSETETGGSTSPSSRQSSVFEAINNKTQHQHIGRNVSPSQRNSSGSQRSGSTTYHPPKRQSSLSELSKMTDDVIHEETYGSTPGMSSQFVAILDEECSMGIAEQPVPLTNVSTSAKRISGTNPTTKPLHERSGSLRMNTSTTGNHTSHQKSPNDFFHPINSDQQHHPQQQQLHQKVVVNHSIAYHSYPLDVSDAFGKDIELDAITSTDSGARTIVAKPSTGSASKSSPTKTSPLVVQQQQVPQKVTALSPRQQSELLQEHRNNNSLGEKSSSQGHNSQKREVVPKLLQMQQQQQQSISSSSLMSKPTSPGQSSKSESNHYHHQVEQNWLTIKKQRETRRNRLFEEEIKNHENVKNIFRRLKAICTQWETATVVSNSAEDGSGNMTVTLPYLHKLEITIVPASNPLSLQYSLKKLGRSLFGMNCTTDKSAVVDNKNLQQYPAHAVKRSVSSSSSTVGEHLLVPHSKSSDAGSISRSTTGGTPMKHIKSSHFPIKEGFNHMTYCYLLENIQQNSADAQTLYFDSKHAEEQLQKQLQLQLQQQQLQQLQHQNSSPIMKLEIRHDPSVATPPAPPLSSSSSSTSSFFRLGGLLSRSSSSKTVTGNKNKTNSQATATATTTTLTSSSSHSMMTSRSGDEMHTLSTSPIQHDLGSVSSEYEHDIPEDAVYDTIRVKIHAVRHIFSKENRDSPNLRIHFYNEIKLFPWKSSLHYQHVTHRYDKETGLLMIFVDRNCGPIPPPAPPSSSSSTLSSSISMISPHLLQYHQQQHYFHHPLSPQFPQQLPSPMPHYHSTSQIPISPSIPTYSAPVNQQSMMLNRAMTTGVIGLGMSSFPSNVNTSDILQNASLNHSVSLSHGVGNRIAAKDGVGNVTGSESAMDDDNATTIRNITKRGRYHFPGDVNLESEGRYGSPLQPKRRSSNTGDNASVISALSNATGLSNFAAPGSAPGTGTGTGTGTGAASGNGPIIPLNGGNNVEKDNESVASSKSNRSQKKSMGGNNTVVSGGSNRERSFPRGLGDEKSSRNSIGNNSGNSATKFNPVDQQDRGSPFQAVKKNRRRDSGASSSIRSSESVSSMNSSAPSSPSTSPATSIVQPYIGTKAYEV